MESPEKKPVATLTQIYGECINRKFIIRSKVTIGRSLKSHIRLSNQNISRNHCIITYSGKVWEITDNKSQNGTYVSGRRLIPGERYLLQCGDIIFLGPPSEMPEAFCFDDTFVDETDEIGAIHVEPKMSPVKRPSDTEALSSPKKRHSTEKSFNDILNEGSKVDGHHLTSSSKVSGESHTSKSTLTKVDRKMKKGVSSQCKRSVLSKENPSSDPSSISKDEEEEDQINEISSTADDQVESSQSLLTENDNATDKLFSPGSSEVFSENTSKNTNETEALKSKLAELAAQVKKLQQSESDLLSQKKTLVQQLDEQNKLKDALKDCETKAKDEVKNELLEKFEEDLICNICTELLIKPTVLDCYHTFCLYCISQWKKKKSECPICRNRIQNMTPVLTLEHLIDKALSTLNPEQRDKRSQLIKERENLQKAATQKKRKKPKASPYRRHHARPHIASHSSSHSRRFTQPGGLNMPTTSHNNEVQVIGDRRNIIIPYTINPFIQHMNFRVPEVLLSDSEMDSSISIYIS